MKIFVAYSAKDTPFVIRLAERLRTNSENVFMTSEVRSTKGFLSEISSVIRSADMMLAVLTDHNPNVLYEVGLAAGANIPILMAMERDQDIPVDLSSVPCVRLTGDERRDIETILRRTDEFKELSTAPRASYNSAEAKLRAAIDDSTFLEALTAIEFVELIASLFRERGYDAVTSGRMGSAGADITVRSEDGRAVLIEVKKVNARGRVSASTVRELASAVAHSGAAAGILVSTSKYTSAATACAVDDAVTLRTLEEVLQARSLGDLLSGERRASAVQQKAPVLRGSSARIVHVEMEAGSLSAAPKSAERRDLLRYLNVQTSNRQGMSVDTPTLRRIREVVASTLFAAMEGGSAPVPSLPSGIDAVLAEITGQAGPLFVTIVRPGTHEQQLRLLAHELEHMAQSLRSIRMQEDEEYKPPRSEF